MIIIEYDIGTYKVPYDLETEVTYHFGMSGISQRVTFGLGLKNKKHARER